VHVCMRWLLATMLLVPLGASGLGALGLAQRAPAALDPTPPANAVKLIFVHHSSGENWLRDDHGGLGLALRDNNYFVSDTNYGWGPADVDVGTGTIGDHTDIGHWYDWFAGPHRDTYLASLYSESGQHSSYSRLSQDPAGPNRIVMFKSCFPNSNLSGRPTDPPTVGSNPMRGRAAGDSSYTLANAKGIYSDLLGYFSARQDVLFVVITAPPLVSGATDATRAGNARALNVWLHDEWLKAYPYHNVAVFDFYDVLTTNGGSANTNDLGQQTGNHHRYRDGAIEYITDRGSNISAYGASSGDSHPTAAGNRKATGEFVSLLNIAYHRWQGSDAGTPTRTLTPTRSSTPTRAASPTPTATRSPTPTTEGSHSPTRSATPTALASATTTPPPDASRSATPTIADTHTQTPGVATATPSPTADPRRRLLHLPLVVGAQPG
jgi:hypothetical protein